MTYKSTTLLSFVMIAFTFFISCKPQKVINQNYFSQGQRDSTHAQILQGYETKIRPGDKLAIYITALNAASAQIYNLQSGSENGQAPAYMVDQKGDIVFPQLGIIHAAGLTKNQLRDLLLNKLKPFLTDPVVIVNVVNLKITVLGEVEKKGTIEMADANINILEALGEAGDIKENGRRDSILVIRENEGKREFGYVNLLSNDAFKSPYFVLQPNDVVYVPMLRSKQLLDQKENFFQRVLPVITTLTSLTSLIWVIYSISK